MMDFNKLTVEKKSTGEVKVLYDGENFKNFNWLAAEVGGSNSDEYIGLNDNLMDGKHANGAVFEHTRYKNAEPVETYIFTYDDGNE